jgi:1-acyl-sn-glycerol-3-phosphate acyltransferase
MMKRVTRYRLWIWRVLWVLIHWLRPLICRIRIEGTEHVPAHGGGVVACNHTLGVDWIALGYASPRELYYMAKAEAFQINRVITWILQQGGVFPVRRGANDVAALQYAINLVRGGHLIGMFPEGTRSQTGALRRAKAGAARIALEAVVPVIPAAVINGPALMTSWKRLRRPLITIRFGPPLHRLLPPGEDLNQAAREFTDIIMRAIAALLPPELRGEYAQPPAPQAEPALSVSGQAEARPEAAEFSPNNERAEGV